MTEILLPSGDTEPVLRLRENFRRLLKAKDLRVAHVSRQTRVPRSTLNNWLSPMAPRDLTAVKRVARFLGVTMDELCFGEKPHSVAGGILSSGLIQTEQIMKYEVTVRKI